jgi:hypothetical protein
MATAVHAPDASRFAAATAPWFDDPVDLAARLLACARLTASEGRRVLDRVVEVLDAARGPVAAHTASVLRHGVVGGDDELRRRAEDDARATVRAYVEALDAIRWYAEIAPPDPERRSWPLVVSPAALVERLVPCYPNAARSILDALTDDASPIPSGEELSGVLARLVRRARIARNQGRLWLEAELAIIDADGVVGRVERAAVVALVDGVRRPALDALLATRARTAARSLESTLGVATAGALGVVFSHADWVCRDAMAAYLAPHDEARLHARVAEWDVR